MSSSQQTALQFQLVQAIQQQAALFNQMNSLLVQLNNGFRALVQAIAKNTEVMMKIAQAPKLAVQTMTGVGNRQVSQHTTDVFAAIGTTIKNAFDPIENLMGNVSTTNMPVAKDLGNRPRGMKGDVQEQLMSAISGMGIGEGLKRNFIGPIQAIGNMPQVSSFLSDLKFKISETFNPAKHRFLGKIGDGFKQVGAFANPMITAFSTMGPQFLAMSLVIQPVTEFLTALLEPFSMISDYFGAFGGILSQALIPVMQAIQPMLQGIMPILQSLVKPLSDVLLGFFNMSSIGMLTQIIGPLMPLISSLVQVFTALVGVVTPFIPILTGVVSKILTELQPVFTWLIDNILTPLINSLTIWGNTISGALSSFDTFRAGFDQFWNALKQFDWNEIGRLVTGGGADNWGWW